MKTLFNDTEFEYARSTDKLPCECYKCGNIFHRYKKEIKYELIHKRGRIKFCSANCNTLYNTFKIEKSCRQCEKIFIINRHELKINNFCSQSCSAVFSNRNRSISRVSKLELFFQDSLTNLYPNLQIDFNNKNTIGAELDIFIPSLNLAFEINGITHYEPIFGQKKLDQSIQNDIFKENACRSKNITLITIDTSKVGYVNKIKSQKFLFEIKKHIDSFVFV